jgi:hypothetical protein
LGYPIEKQGMTSAVSQALFDDETICGIIDFTLD